MSLNFSVKISKKIIDNYEKNIKNLSIYQTGHFFTRAFKITGNKQYEDRLCRFMLSYEPNIISDFFSRIRKEEIQYKAPKEKLLSSLRIKERYLFYEKNPRTKLYLDVLQYLIYVDKFNLWDFILKKEKNRFIEILRRESFIKLFLNDEAIKTNGSYIFNSLSVLKKIEICDLTEKAVCILKKIYFNEDLSIKRNISKNEIISMLYSLTHLIIADTLYYERYCNKYGWVTDFFAKNLDFIIKNSTEDVLAEVGLCFKFCRKENLYKKEFRKIKRHILIKFSTLKLRKAQYIIKNEHTNSLIMLLFAENEEIFKGPDLSKNKMMQKNIR